MDQTVLMAVLLGHLMVELFLLDLPLTLAATWTPTVSVVPVQHTTQLPALLTQVQPSPEHLVLHLLASLEHLLLLTQVVACIQVLHHQLTPSLADSLLQ